MQIRGVCFGNGLIQRSTQGLGEVWALPPNPVCASGPAAHSVSHAICIGRVIGQIATWRSS
jgi:hypothetical protein